jgi:hypothetical protein
MIRKAISWVPDDCRFTAYLQNPKKIIECFQQLGCSATPKKNLRLLKRICLHWAVPSPHLGGRATLRRRGEVRLCGFTVSGTKGIAAVATARTARAWSRPSAFWPMLRVVLTSPRIWDQTVHIEETWRDIKQMIANPAAPMTPIAFDGAST